MYKFRHRAEVSDIFKLLKGRSCVRRYLDELKAHHRETYDHSLRVAKLSIDLAIENKLPVNLVKIVGCAALLHDYGKSKISTEILSKCGPLDEEEAVIMRTHPKHGLKELKRHFPISIRKIIAAHHDENVDPLTQIVKAADMYDALVFPRSYKRAFGANRVRDIMLEQFTGRPRLISQLSKRPRHL